ncbi:hypothetical protein [Reichenbachiella ulvae]|uniref:Uncharacterized protein n=1 Tax=Reichenbachiella ulvae TaxID=2980104 RepID=A0ABT3CSX3_9BACT|nr:hypothetical protein [Reichenbachiella ulvae]MCV9386744.1 hypothetical protein [Reichenbachiella ulvae]
MNRYFIICLFWVFMFCHLGVDQLMAQTHPLLFVSLEKEYKKSQCSSCDDIKSIVDDRMEQAVAEGVLSSFQKYNLWKQSFFPKTDTLNKYNVRFVVTGVLKYKGNEAVIALKVEDQRKGKELYQPFLSSSIQLLPGGEMKGGQLQELNKWINRLLEELNYLKRNADLKESVQLHEIELKGVDGMTFFYLSSFHDKFINQLDQALNRSYYLYISKVDAEEWNVYIHPQAVADQENVKIMIMLKNEANISFTDEPFDSSKYDEIVAKLAQEIGVLLNQ